MKWLLLSLVMISSVANAKISVYYGVKGEKMRQVSFELDQKNKVFSFDELSTMCEIDFQKGKIIVFCDHKENGTGTISNCNGEDVLQMFQNKKNKKTYLATIKCDQGKI